MTSKSKVNIFYDLESSGLGKQLPNSRFNNYAWEQIYQFGYIVMDEDFDGVVTEAEFMRSHLRSAGFSSDALNAIREQFNVLDADGDGMLTTKDLEIADTIAMETMLAEVADNKQVKTVNDSGLNISAQQLNTKLVV